MMWFYYPYATHYPLTTFLPTPSSPLLIHPFTSSLLRHSLIMYVSHPSHHKLPRRSLDRQLDRRPTSLNTQTRT